MKHLLCFFIVLFTILFISPVFAQEFNGEQLRTDLKEDLTDPGVNLIGLRADNFERIGDDLRVEGEFDVVNIKEKVSPSFEYALYGGEIGGIGAVSRPTLPESTDGGFVLDPEERRTVDFDVVLEGYFENRQNAIEVALVNERGYTYRTRKLQIRHEENEYYPQYFITEGQSIIYNGEEEFGMRNGITLYQNEDRADIKIILPATPKPFVVIPEVTYFERSYFSEPVLIKKYAPVTTQVGQSTELLLPVTLTDADLRPTIYPFRVDLDVQSDVFADTMVFGRITYGGITAKVVNTKFNGVNPKLINRGEKISSIEFVVDGALPDVNGDRRQETFNAEFTLNLIKNGEVIYTDVRETVLLSSNEIIFVIDENIKARDFDTVEVEITHRDKVIESYTQEFDFAGKGFFGYLMEIVGLLIVIALLILGYKLIHHREREVPVMALLVGFGLLMTLFIGVTPAEAGSKDYYDNRLGCEKEQNPPPPPVDGGDPDADSGSGEGGGAAVGNPWFVADKYINKWIYTIDGAGGPEINGEEEGAPIDLGDPIMITTSVDGMGCVAPGSIIELSINLSVGICSNSGAAGGENVTDVAVFQMTTGFDWYIDYGGVYEPADIAHDPLTKPCPDGNDKTFDRVHGGNPDFENMYNRKNGWTVISQGESTTAAGDSEVTETITLSLKAPDQPGTYTLGTRLTVDPTKGGGITETQESIPIEVCGTERDYCYLIEGLQYIDNGVLKDASDGDPSTPDQPSPGDPSIDEYVVQYVSHDEAFDQFTVDNIGTASEPDSVALYSVCNLCPNPIRETLDLNGFTNRKRTWEEVTRGQLDAHRTELGANSLQEDVDRRYSQVAYQGLRTDGASLVVASGTNDLNDAVVQHFDNGTQNKGVQSRMLKGVMWPSFYDQKLGDDFDEIQDEIRLLNNLAILKRQEAAQLANVITIWTNLQGEPHYSDPYGFGDNSQFAFAHIVPGLHIDGGSPVNYQKNVPYRNVNGPDPFEVYDYGHYIASYPPVLRGIDAALRNLYDADFYGEAMGYMFETADLDAASGPGDYKYNFSLQYPDNQYDHGGGELYSSRDFESAFSDGEKQSELSHWLSLIWGDPYFDGSIPGYTFPGDNYWKESVAENADTYDTYYRTLPLSNPFGGAAMFVKDIWQDLISARESAILQSNQYRARQVELLIELGELPELFKIFQEEDLYLAENYRLYREKILQYDGNYEPNLAYLESISGILRNIGGDPEFPYENFELYHTFVGAFYNNVDLAFEHLIDRVDLDYSDPDERPSLNTGLADGDVSDTYIVQLINGNDRTCIAFEDICSAEAGVQSAFLNESDPTIVEVYDINLTSGAKTDHIPGTPEVDPRKSAVLATTSISALCDQTPRPVCPNNAAWEYDSTTNAVYQVNSDISVTDTLYYAPENACLTSCPFEVGKSYDGGDAGANKPVYDTADAVNNDPLGNWYYDSVSTMTCIEDACPTIAGAQELVGGTDPAEARDAGTSNTGQYYISAISGGSQCVVEACLGGTHPNPGTIYWNDGGTIRDLGGNDTGFSYNAATDTCTTSDVCRNLAGPQASAPSGYEQVFVGGKSYCDYCSADLAGIQQVINNDTGKIGTWDTSTDILPADEEEGYYKIPGGACVIDQCVGKPLGGGADVDLYKAVTLDPATAPYLRSDDNTETEYELHTDGFCYVDQCLNNDDYDETEGVQPTVPTNFVQNNSTDRICTPVDQCINIPGTQISVDPNYHHDPVENTCDYCHSSLSGKIDISGIQTRIGNQLYTYDEINDELNIIIGKDPNTCAQNICVDIDGDTSGNGNGFSLGTGSNSGRILFENGGANPYVTDLESLDGADYSCGCDTGLRPTDQDSYCYTCSFGTNYIWTENGNAGCNAIFESCIILDQTATPTGSSIVITEEESNLPDGTHNLASQGGAEYIMGTDGVDRTCQATSGDPVPPTLTTTPDFIEPGGECTVDLTAIGYQQCKITLISADTGLRFDNTSSCTSGNGSQASECVIDATDGINVIFEAPLTLTQQSQSSLVVAECANDTNADDIIDSGDYTATDTKLDAECRLVPKIREI